MTVILPFAHSFKPTVLVIWHKFLLMTLNVSVVQVGLPGELSVIHLMFVEDSTCYVFS